MTSGLSFEQIDAMTPQRRALVHEYGEKPVRDLLALFGDDVADAVLQTNLERDRQKRRPDEG